MSDNAKKDTLRLGFLTAVEDGERGYIGGLLITNRFGRPLEFQCTSPVRPNKTQQILYGPTLKPYLLSDLIGRTLVEKVGVKPHVVLTEHPELLDLREHVAMPVACFTDKDHAGEKPSKLGNRWLSFHASHAEDSEEIARHADQVPSSADLREPFDRVREALQETMKLAAR